MRAHNIMEDIVENYLNEMLNMRYDICTCESCREEMLAYILTRVPPRYVTTDTGAMHTLMEEVKVEKSSLILKEIIGGINTVAQNPRHKSDDREQAYQLLIQQIKLDRGADFSQYRDRILKRRIALRMQAKKAKTYSEYLQVLIHEPSEYEQLFDVLTINVSSFFRDQLVWDKIRQEIVPAVIAAKKSAGMSKIRVWSAGCAHGQEPYSMAILLFEVLEKWPEKFGIEIIATDIDKESLRLAAAARYERASLRNITSEQMRRFFIPYQEQFLLVPHVKELVKFKQQNLIHDPGPAAVDIVLCRNVFIYFNRSLQEHLIMKFYHCLVPGGYFVMGNSENLMGEARQLFRDIDFKLMIFQKIKT